MTLSPIYVVKPGLACLKYSIDENLTTKKLLFYLPCDLVYEKLHQVTSSSSSVSLVMGEEVDPRPLALTPGGRVLVLSSVIYRTLFAVLCSHTHKNLSQ
jgi:hypothetical protein